MNTRDCGRFTRVYGDQFVDVFSLLAHKKWALDGQAIWRLGLTEFCAFVVYLGGPDKFFNNARFLIFKLTVTFFNLLLQCEIYWAIVYDYVPFIGFFNFISIESVALDPEFAFLFVNNIWSSKICWGGGGCLGNRSTIFCLFSFSFCL